MSDTKVETPVFFVADVDFDRSSRNYATRAEAIEEARKSCHSICGKVAYVMQAVAKVTPASAPATVIDL